MAILIPDMDMPENCLECCLFQEGYCVVSNNYIWNDDDGYDEKKHKFKTCPLHAVDIDFKLFSMVVNYCKSHTIKEFTEMNRMYEERKNDPI